MDTIFDTTIPFEKRVKNVYLKQLESNTVYKKYCSALGLHQPDSISSDQIQLLPIRAFKDTELRIQGMDPELIFKSSGTEDTNRSTHYIPDSKIYRKAIESEFYRYFPKADYSILAYTPGYNENPDSSLIWMIHHLVQQDESGLSRFLDLEKPLSNKDFEPIILQNRKVILFGAAFGLLDLIDLKSKQLPKGSEIIETGGMKTHRRELSKTELRKKLSEGFNIPFNSIHSEYGMCELLSQCYAIGGEWFEAPHWVKVTIRKDSNPQQLCKPGEAGKIGIIDLANVHSCSFILTEDKGVMDKNGKFQVLGRWDDQDLRGCNFLIDKD